MWHALPQGVKAIPTSNIPSADGGIATLQSQNPTISVTEVNLPWAYPQ